MTIIGQSNFIDGRITLKNNNIIEGQIDYQEWRNTPESIKFKNGENITSYTPSDLLGFEVEGGKYVSQNVKLDVTEQVLRKMHYTDEPRFENKAIFLHLLYDGKSNLYHYYDSRSHYFVFKDGKYIELINRIALTENNEDVQNNKKYIGQLSYLFSDCNSVNPKSNLQYKENDLVKIFREYDNCFRDEANQVEEVSTGKKHKLYAKGAFYFSNFKLESPDRFLNRIDGGSFTMPTLGIAYDIAISKNRNKWSLHNELVYYRINQEFEVDEELTNYDDITFNLDYSIINLNTLVKHRFKAKNDNILPFILVGFGYNFNLQSDNSVSYTISSSGNRRSEEIGSIGYFSLSAGLGVDYKKFIFELRYTVTDKIISNNYTKNNISNFGLVLGYHIF